MHCRSTGRGILHEDVHVMYAGVMVLPTSVFIVAVPSNVIASF